MDVIDAMLVRGFPLLMLITGFVTLIAGLFLAFLVLDEKHKIGKKRAYWAGRNNTRKTPEDIAAEQLKTVSKATFTSRCLLNKSEAKVFDTLDTAVISRNSGWQVMAQVSLGEFLTSADTDAYFAVNSKRVDFALMDEKCRVVHALEYQGSGHHQGSAAARDAVKKEALRKAGIGYHEIVAGHTTPKELRQLVEKLVPSAVGGFGKKQRAA